MSSGTLQPLLHDLVSCLSAPTIALSGTDGQIDAVGAIGLYCGDVRVLSKAVVRVDGQLPEAIGTATEGADQVSFVGLLRHLGDAGPDPTVWLRRRRQVSNVGMTELLTLDNESQTDVRFLVDVETECDLAKMEEVKAGLRPFPKVIRLDAETLVVVGEAVTVRIAGAGATVFAADVSTAGLSGLLRWDLAIPARSSVTVWWSVTVSDRSPVLAAPVVPPTWSRPSIRADDWRLAAWLERSIGDLAKLRATLLASPGDEFLTAGSPWFLALFGRDSIWAARMMLPVGTDIARGTLRSLAARQGSAVVLATAEEPGKILHELRRETMTIGATSLPPVYYGTIDATPLWVCLLTDAWRWGMAAGDVEGLLPAAERALRWMADCGDQDGDGFLEYIDHTGHGLANQGWKDSGDAVRNEDGSIATGPIALAEVQGYAYEAAMGGAALFDAFGRPGAAEWRTYARRMAKRFREQFWIDDAAGKYPAVALDGAKHPIRSMTSNIGHLLGSGMLDGDEARLIADRLTDPTMASGFGLRTMSSAAAGYSPLSYHCGSVWPHDTAIAIHGLARAGLHGHASLLSRQLANAASAFDYQLPELFSGFSIDDYASPLPYPASCRPQAWAAAAALVVLQAAVGLQPDVPNGNVQINPTATFGALAVEGLQLAGQPLAIGSDATGALTSTELPSGLRLVS